MAAFNSKFRKFILAASGDCGAAVALVLFLVVRFGTDDGGDDLVDANTKGTSKVVLVLVTEADELVSGDV